MPEIEILTDCSRAIVNTLVKNGYLEIIEKKIERNPLAYKKLEKTNNFRLTEEQEKAYKEVENIINKNEYKSFLLYGVTRFTEKLKFIYN